MAISREHADGNSAPQRVLPQFEVQDSVCDGHHMLALSGELDLAEAPGLETMITRLCGDGVKGISLDLSRLTFMDSSGLQVVLHAQQLCREHGHDFFVVPGNAQVLRLFEIAGVIDALPIVDP
ncbi:MAG TPA: STAS domain-containing protein [Solirubrobacteraceae bacterium]|jgi:anti-sigma B factor antagonist